MCHSCLFVANNKNLEFSTKLFQLREFGESNEEHSYEQT